MSKIQDCIFTNIFRAGREGRVGWRQHEEDSQPGQQDLAKVEPWQQGLVVTKVEKIGLMCESKQVTVDTWISFE